MSWVSLRPSDDTIARARAERARAGSVLPPTRRFDSEHEWVGPLGELAVCAWLSAKGVDHQRHGGADDRPDIELLRPGGYGLAVKTQLVFTEFRPHFGIVVPGGQVPHGDVFCFCAYQEPDNRLLIVGFIGVPRFFASASPRAVGQAIGPKTVARWDCFQLPAHRLTDPDAWLAQLDQFEQSWAG
jgi:hypothetical protein